MTWFLGLLRDICNAPSQKLYAKLRLTLHLFQNYMHAYIHTYMPLRNRSLHLDRDFVCSPTCMNPVLPVWFALVSSGTRPNVGIPFERLRD